jgi:hypothetical protein
MNPLEIFRQRLSRRDLLKAGVGLVAGGGVVANEVRQEQKIDAEVTERELTDKWVGLESSNSLIRDRELLVAVQTLYQALEQTRAELGLPPLVPQEQRQEPQSPVQPGGQA